ncbi:hypothetical protein DICA0_E31890 [Diutina catenulata]
MFASLTRVFSRGDQQGDSSDWGIDDLAPPPPIAGSDRGYGSVPHSAPVSAPISDPNSPLRRPRPAPPPAMYSDHHSQPSSATASQYGGSSLRGGHRGRPSISSNPDHFDSHFPSSSHHPYPSKLDSWPEAHHQFPPGFDLKYYHYKYGVPLPPATNENCHKFVAKYLGSNGVEAKFWEQFKYALIVSSLLDDSMILSKNDQALAALEAARPDPATPPEPPTSWQMRYPLSILSDAVRVDQYPSYRLRVPRLYQRHQVLFIIHMVITLLKYNQRTYFGSSHRRLVFVLLVYATKVAKYHRLTTRLRTSQALGEVDKFLASNYRINRRIILHLIALKERETFGSVGVDPYKERLATHVKGAIQFLVFNLEVSVAKMVNYINGDIFEQYCSINNIDMAVVASSFAEYHYERTAGEPAAALDELIFLINKFNQLRKMLICQLLSVQPSPTKKNFFVHQLMDSLMIESPERDVATDTDGVHVPMAVQLTQIHAVLVQVNNTTATFASMFDQFDDVNRAAIARGSHANDNVLSFASTYTSGAPLGHTRSQSTGAPVAPESSLAPLADKLAALSTNIRFFQKYHASTRSTTSIDEVTEKIMIFHQFADELEAARALHASTLAELQRECYPSQSASSNDDTTASPRVSKSEGPFSLKTFQNSALKKRFSLPASTVGATVGAAVAAAGSPTTNSGAPSPQEKRKKRSSSGLQLGLVTVVEEQPRPTSGSRLLKSPIDLSSPAYDDNYVNILPPPTFESYNQTTLDQLSRSSPGGRPAGIAGAASAAKQKHKFSIRNSNRYSMNSLSSNISGLTDMITATQLTNYDDMLGDPDSDSNRFSRDELKQKLEESFDRIYSLESENQALKMNHDSADAANDLPGRMARPNPAFLASLEQALSDRK